MLVKLGEISVDPLHQLPIVFTGQGFPIHVPQGQLLRQDLIEHHVLILLDGLVDAAVRKGPGGDQLNSGKPFVKQKKCIGCRACARICAHGAPQFGADGKATIDTDKCVGCARCLAVCPKDAIQCLYDEAPAILNKKIAEYTKAVVDGRPCFHVSLVVDVSPNCDCHAENDVPIVPDVGMFASFDPVALDQACADAVLAQTPAPNSALFDEGCDCSSGDYFHAAHPDTDWAVCLEHAEKIGIGTRAYELIKI